MGRLRASLARSSVDQQVQGYVASAQRSIQEALSICRRARHERSPNAARAARVERDLARVLAALGNVGQVAPRYDTNDPDLNPEVAARLREAREARQQAPPEEPEEVEAEDEVVEEPEPEPEGSEGD